MKRHVGWLDVIYAGALGALVSLFFWQSLNPRILPFSVTLLGVIEVFVQIRWRMSLPCPKCGFDPLVYLRSPERAAEKVKKKFTERLENPNILDKRLPVIDILDAQKNGKTVALRAEPSKTKANSDGQVRPNKI